MNKKHINKPELSPGTTLVDTHCHLDMRTPSDKLELLIQNAANAGVTRIITVGIDLESSQKAIMIAQRFPGVWATIGIHPHNADSGNPETYQQLHMLAQDMTNKIVGYGEIGLDYAKKYVPINVQVTNFKNQLAHAKELKLPIIIHDRDAHDDTIDILKSYAPYPASGVMHCFSGDLQLAKQVIDLGLYISIPGIVTFNKSEAIQEVASQIPLEWMILETDAPFLAPVPYRGKSNKPEYLIYTAQKIADLREIELDEVAKQTTANAKKLFHLSSRETRPSDL